MTSLHVLYSIGKSENSKNSRRINPKTQKIIGQIMMKTKNYVNYAKIRNLNPLQITMAMSTYRFNVNMPGLHRTSQIPI